MKRILLPILLACILLPLPSMAQYRFMGGASQPLALVDSPTRDQLFRTWKPNGLARGGWDLVLSSNLLRNKEDSEDLDVILALTGAYGLGDRTTIGLTVPAIIRDAKFNASGLLDLRAFGRYRFSADGAPLRTAGELAFILPTAGTAEAYGSTTYPFSLETTVARAAFSLAGGSSPWEYGLNAGYQAYLKSETGRDSDVLYGGFLQRDLAANLDAVLEYAGSSHSHTGSGAASLASGTVSLGVLYRAGKGVRLGLAVGKGMAENASDWVVTGNLVASWGGVGASGAPATAAPPAAKAPVSVQKAPPPPRLPPGISFAGVKPGKGGVLVMVANRSGEKGLGERLAAWLKKQGYTVVMVDELGKDVWERSRLYHKGVHKASSGEIARLIRKEAVSLEPYPLTAVDVLLVVGKDLSDWRP